MFHVLLFVVSPKNVHTSTLVVGSSSSSSLLFVVVVILMITFVRLLDRHQSIVISVISNTVIHPFGSVVQVLVLVLVLVCCVVLCPFTDL